MIIDSAFINTMSSAIKSASWEELNEERLRGLFLDKTYEQFQLLFLDKTKIFSQCPYPLAKIKRVDIKVCLPNVQSSADLLSQYGAKEENWIEIKYLKGKRLQTKDIKKDIVRLCLFVDEHQEKIRKNARYLLLVSDFLNKKEKNGANQIFKIFKPGLSKDIKIDLTGIFNNFKLKIDVYTRDFIPFWTSEYKIRYCGYLIKIIKFTLTDNNNRKVFGYSDEPGQSMSKEDVGNLLKLSNKFKE